MRGKRVIDRQVIEGNLWEIPHLSQGRRIFRQPVRMVITADHRHHQRIITQVTITTVEPEADTLHIRPQIADGGSRTQGEVKFPPSLLWRYSQCYGPNILFHIAIKLFKPMAGVELIHTHVLRKIQRPIGGQPFVIHINCSICIGVDRWRSRIGDCL